MALDNADDIGISHSSTPTIELEGHSPSGARHTDAQA